MYKTRITAPRINADGTVDGFEKAEYEAHQKGSNYFVFRNGLCYWYEMKNGEIIFVSDCTAEQARAWGLVTKYFVLD